MLAPLITQPWEEGLTRWPWSVQLQVRRLRSQHQAGLSCHIWNRGGGAAVPRLGALKGLFSYHPSVPGAGSHRHHIPGWLPLSTPQGCVAPSSPWPGWEHRVGGDNRNLESVSHG